MPSKKKTKIVATLGPATSRKEVIVDMIKAGVDVFRINFSHADYEDVTERVKMIREVNEEMQTNIAILGDLQGPKIRVDKLKAPLELKSGDTWVIGASSVQSKYPDYKNCFIPTVYENLVRDAHEGAVILFDDGLMEARAIEKDGDVLKIEIVVGGMLKSNKGINLPNVNISAPSFTEKDSRSYVFTMIVYV